MALPKMDESARKAALERASEARVARARYKVALKGGEATLGEALASEDRVVTRMRVRELLESLPGVGRGTAAKVMASVGIADDRRVSGLGSRQRAELLSWWEGRNEA